MDEALGFVRQYRARRLAEGVRAPTGLTATWVKNAVDQRLVLRGPDGNPVRLAAGNTWVELVPTDTGSVTVG